MCIHIYTQYILYTIYHIRFKCHNADQIYYIVYMYFNLEGVFSCALHTIHIQYTYYVIHSNVTNPYIVVPQASRTSGARLSSASKCGNVTN